MAQSQLLVLACMALLASSACAACTEDFTQAVNQTAVLATDTPKGCLTDDLLTKNSVPVTKMCFDNVTISRLTGAGCNNFSVALLDGNSADCLGGLGPVGNGTLTAAKGGAYAATGSFVSGQDFTGTQSADNKTMTVSVDGFNCKLTYNLRAAAPAANATSSDNATATNATTRGAATNATGGATTATTTKASGVAAALPSAVLLVLGAAVALAF